MSQIAATTEGQENGESTGRHLVRVLAFACLALLWLPSLALTGLSAYAWWRTLDATKRFLSLSSGAIAPTPESGLLGRLIHLDLSTASASIMLIFSLCLFCGITRILVRRARAGSWEKFASRTNTQSLFPTGLRALCIRFGLLGTLLSFTFAAMGLSGDAVGKPAPLEPPEGRELPGLARPPEAPEKPRTESTDGVSPSGKSDQLAEVEAASVELAGAFSVGATESSLGLPSLHRRSGDSSFKVFLMLCAALYSTLVGALVGYVVIPALEGPARCATRPLGLPPGDPEAIQDRLLRRMEGGAEALGLLTRQVGSFRQIADSLRDGVKALAAAVAQVRDFSESVKSLSDGIAEVRTAASTSIQAVSALAGLSGALGELTQTYKRQVLHAETVIVELRKVSEEQTNRVLDAFDGLTVAADAVRSDFVGPIRQFVASCPGLVDGLVAQVNRLFRLQDEQKTLMERMLKAVEACEKPISYGGEQLARATHMLRSQARKTGGQYDRAVKVIERTLALADQLERVVSQPQGAGTGQERISPPREDPGRDALAKPGFLRGSLRRLMGRTKADHEDKAEPNDRAN